MKPLNWERLKKLRGLLATDRPEPQQQAERIVTMLRDVVLPAKLGLCLVVLYYMFYSGWLLDEQTSRSVTLETLKKFFLVYLACNFVGGILFASWRRLPPELVQWLAFTLGILDGIFMCGITIATGGFSSIAFWVFPGLIVLNALTIPLAMPQMVLNLSLSVLYLGAVLLTPHLGLDDTRPGNELLANMVTKRSTILTGENAVRTASTQETNVYRGTNIFHGTNQTPRLTSEMLSQLIKSARKSSSIEDNPADEVLTDQLIQRVAMLWLLTLCCYGTQVLLERQRRALMEAAEFAAREGQLHSAGRLAAEFAHQIKNPLAIINNAAYSLHRSLGQAKSSATQQLEIIQEEVARADKVITQIMNYAQLSEGRVEKLRVVEVIEAACDQVFPSAVPSAIKLKKRFNGPFPSLLMQRGHLMEILVNLLKNAREALGTRGNVQVTASCDRNEVVEISVADDGPGIPPDKVERIFEAYFTTKEKGTGLGLAIVKHNVELYGGTMRLESVLGKGAKFTVLLPAKSQPKPLAK